MLSVITKATSSALDSLGFGKAKHDSDSYTAELELEAQMPKKGTQYWDTLHDLARAENNTLSARHFILDRLGKCGLPRITRVADKVFKLKKMGWHIQTIRAKKHGEFCQYALSPTQAEYFLSQIA